MAGTERYPGRNCPGLIEASTKRAIPTLPESYPGRNCPGLIEATTMAVRGKSCQAVSGA